MGKNKGGRPPIYKTPEELQEVITGYLASCEITGVPLTITGLCLFCKFESRQSFYDMEKRDGFTYTIKSARLQVEHSYELKLHGKQPAAGIIFALKNMGWTDQQQIDLTSGGEAMGFTIGIVDASTDKTR